MKNAIVVLLQDADKLTTDTAQKELIAQKVEAHKAAIVELEAQAAAEQEAAEKAAAEQAADPLLLRHHGPGNHPDHARIPA